MSTEAIREFAMNLDYMEGIEFIDVPVHDQQNTCNGACGGGCANKLK